MSSVSQWNREAFGAFSTDAFSFQHYRSIPQGVEMLVWSAQSYNTLASHRVSTQVISRDAEEATIVNSPTVNDELRSFKRLNRTWPR